MYLYVFMDWEVCIWLRVIMKGEYRILHRVSFIRERLQTPSPNLGVTLPLKSTSFLSQKESKCRTLKRLWPHSHLYRRYWYPDISYIGWNAHHECDVSREQEKKALPRCKFYHNTGVVNGRTREAFRPLRYQFSQALYANPWSASQSAWQNYPTVSSLPTECVTAEPIHHGFHLYISLLWRKLWHYLQS